MRKSVQRKRILLEGSRNGKMPTPRFTKWGWWFWPCTAIAVVAGTYWGTRHIEVHLEKAAPQILQNAGVNPEGLEFKAHHRTMNVAGTLPAGVSAKDVEIVLTKYTGTDGESIRSAIVSAKPKVNRVEPVEPKELTTRETQKTRDPIPQAVDISVTVNADGERITLFGVVPSQQHSETLLNSVNQYYNPDNVENHLIVAKNAASIDDPDRYINDLATVLSKLNGDVSNAHLNLNNEHLSGDIYANSDPAKRRLKSGLSNSTVNVITSDYAELDYGLLAVTEADTLQHDLVSLAHDISDKVVFEAASDELSASAYPVLDQIADAMLLNVAPSVEVGGHTDSSSSSDFNFTLSEKRAQAVVRYLVERGVDPLRLHPVGYGESQPKFSNDTSEGRAQNRRVEFWVLQNQLNNSNH